MTSFVNGPQPPSVANGPTEEWTRYGYRAVVPDNYQSADEYFIILKQLWASGGERDGCL